MEEVLESGDVSEAIDDIVSEWNAEDVDDLFESICVFFADSNIEIQFLLDDEFEDEEEVDYDDVFNDDDVADTDEEFDAEDDVEGEDF